MIDTHCHLTYKPLDKRVEQVIARALDAGVDRMISVGTSPEDAVKAAALAEKYDQLYATVGIHPHYAADYCDRSYVASAMADCIAQPKVVGFGEMGLDYYYDEPSVEDQRRVFQWQLEIVAQLSEQNGKRYPVVIHNRQATDDVIAMIHASGLPGEQFVFHCFTGEGEDLDKVLQLGAMVGFTGIITFKNAKAIAECADRVPDDRLLIETDSPYLTPEPHRKVRPNEPMYVGYVARFLAARRGMNEGDFIKMVDANAERFFGLAGE